MALELRVRSDKTPEEMVAERRRVKRQVREALDRYAELRAAVAEVEEHYRRLPRPRAD